MRIQSTHLVTSDPRATGTTLAVPFQSNLMCISSGTLSASFTTPAVSILFAEHWSGTAKTDGVKGIATWQISNDANVNNEYATIDVQDWVDYPNLDAAMPPLKSPAGTPCLVMWNLQNQAYRWIRFKWTHQSGTGSIDVSLCAKG